MPPHAKPLDAQAKGEAGDLFRVVADGRSTLGSTMPAPPNSIQSSFQLMSTSTLGSVNGKNDGRKRMCDVAAQVAAGEQPQHALQVGHGHLLVDQQALPSGGTWGSAWRRPCRAGRRDRAR